ncbi:MAG: Cas10/Cmr2 second palm domain-containing protein [Myxococcota bacterium]
MAQKYLYGASVQGIQSFIFQTDKLKEIIGASELVELVCTTLFANLVFNGPEAPFDLEALKEKRDSLDQMLLDEENHDCLMAAAGNIKYLLDEEQCKNIYLHFPRQVALFAPGITISQAVVPMDKEVPEQADIDKLEAKLKAKRNQPVTELEAGWSVNTRVSSTGKPALEVRKPEKEGQLLDAATKQKLDAGKAMADSKLLNALVGDFPFQNTQIPYDMEDLVQGDGKSWIAVVHADGNSLGQIIGQLATGSEKKTGNVFRQFSRELDRATKLAAQKAFEKVFSEEFNDKNSEKLGIRPVIIGGDDFTFICRADMALAFTSRFLEFFEETTKSGFAPLVEKMGLKIDRLTACAGIAYIKKNYPLHYGLDLAETLCSNAKKASKKDTKDTREDGYVPASLAFHKVQDSFVTDWALIKKREMFFPPDSTEKTGIDFDYGPYAIKEEYANTENLASLQDLEGLKNILESPDAPKSNLRQWLTELTHDFWSGGAKIDRLLMVMRQRGQEDLIEKLGLEKYASEKLNQKIRSTDSGSVVKSPLYHALMLTSLKE